VAQIFLWTSKIPLMVTPVALCELCSSGTTFRRGSPTSYQQNSPARYPQAARGQMGLDYNVPQHYRGAAYAAIPPST
jgi:hypothetical protein